MARFARQPGLLVLNAVDASSRILGSCALRLGYRHSEYILGDEEYRYGASSAGPAYFWPDDEKCPWILVVKSFWVRPTSRRLGIARGFAEYARGLGLPGYLGFANKHMEEFFNREFRPTRKTSPLQEKIARALAAPAKEFEPNTDPHFTVFVQAEASALHLWNSWHGGLDEPVGLDQVLCFPDRADIWEIDSGEAYEAGYSDSGYADDLCFGYALSPWLDSWGPEDGPYDAIPTEASDATWNAAAAAYATKSSCAAGSIDGWVLDPEAMLAYAAIRHFLRTLRWQAFDDLDAAARELFVKDLAEQPRGLRRFSGLVSPIEVG
jgi:hypothetical protein